MLKMPIHSSVLERRVDALEVMCTTVLARLEQAVKENTALRKALIQANLEEPGDTALNATYYERNIVDAAIAKYEMEKYDKGHS